MQRLYAVAILSVSCLVVGCASPATTASKSAPAVDTSGLKFSVARSNEHEGKLPSALALYKEMYEADPTNAEVCHRLGVVSLRMGHKEDGVLYLMEADGASPNDVTILADLGYAHVMNGDMELAEQFLRRSLNMNPKDERTINNLALAVGYSGRIDEAYGLYRQIGDDAEAHANVGYILSQRGETQAALKRYSRSLDLDPTNRRAAEAMVQMAEINTELIARNEQSQQEASIQLTGGTETE